MIASCIALLLLAPAALENPSDGPASASTPGPVADAGRLRIAAAFEPLGGFVENRGQWPAEVLFFARAGRVEATVMREGFVLRPLPELDDQGRPVRASKPLFVRFAGGAAAEAVVGVDAGPTKHHFIHARGSARDARGFASVRLESVWPGIDVVLRRDGGAFAYDLHVAAGAELGTAVLEFVGASDPEIADRSLSFETPEGAVVQRLGAAWQTAPDGSESPVEPRFEVVETTDESAVSVGFQVDGRDPSRALVIDPTLVFSSYVGGPESESAPEIAAGPDGSAFLTCWGFGNAPLTPGAFDTTYEGFGPDGWIGKLSPSGDVLEWATLLGGGETDNVEDVAVAPDGTVVVFGMTWSDGFPITANALQSVETGINDCFVTRLAADGASLVWSTRLGSTKSDIAQAALACTPDNSVVVAIEPRAPDTPNLPPLGHDATWDDGDYLIARIAADGSSIEAATYLKVGRILDLAVDGQSKVYVGGDVSFGGGDVTPGAHQTLPVGPEGSGSGYAAKLSADLEDLLYGTYVGGSIGTTSIWGIAVDAAGCLYLATQSGADESPVTPGAFQTSVLPTFSSPYIAKLLPQGTGIAWGSFLGNVTGSGYTESIAVDAAGMATVGGGSNSPGWPVTLDAHQTVFIGPTPSGDGALSRFDPVGEALTYSTWFGGTGSDRIRDVATGPDGRVLAVLTTTAVDFPVTPGAYDTTKAGSTDLGVAAFDLGLAPWRVLGHAKPGATETPNLVGTGVNKPGTPTRLALRGALPGVPVFFVVGGFEVNFPLFGGTLVPYPDLILTRFTNALGWNNLQFPWPDLFPGQTVTFQAWCYDPGVLELFSASNGLRALAQ